MHLRRLPALLLLVLPSAAWAGRQSFNEILDDEVLPARGVEIQSRITDRIGSPGGDDETALWWAGVFGLSDRVELVLPVEIALSHADGTTQFTWYAAELRWRLAPAGPPPAPGHVVPLLRVSVERVNEEPAIEGAADLVLGTDLSHRVHGALMVGGVAQSTGAEAGLRGGVGVTGNVTNSLRAGGEVFGELPLLPAGESPSISAGPDLSYTLGAFWVTAGGLVGIGPTRAYATSLRISWGIEL